VDEMADYRRWTKERLLELLRSTSEDSPIHLHASLALLPIDPGQVEFLQRRLVVGIPSELPVLRERLKPHAATLTPFLWSALEAANPEDRSPLPAAGALALYDSENPRWASVVGKVARALVSVDPVYLGQWLDALRPVRGKLTAPLATVFRD